MNQAWKLGLGWLLALPFIAMGTTDCNSNGIDDVLDISAGSSLDVNGNSIPDECEMVKVIYVDQSMASEDTSANWGYDWGHAYKHLSTALKAHLYSGSTNTEFVEIWVAEGTYNPSPSNSSDYNMSFVLYPFVSILGGFDGTETSNDQRDPDSHVTILTGELQGDSDITNNSYSVVTAWAWTRHSYLDGFVITEGNADDASNYRYGGGLYNQGSPIINHCTFLNNRAISGGAVCNWGAPNPRFVGCRFIGNIATGASTTGGYFGFGGAVYTHSDGDSIYINCEFSGNEVDKNSDSSGGIGGAMCFNQHGVEHRPSATIINCTFSGNDAESAGGAIYTIAAEDVSIANSILWNNVANGVSNEDTQITGGSGMPPLSSDISDTCIQGCSVTGYCPSGTSNIGDDPIFNDADGADDTLGTDDDDVHLLGSSPCIDDGDNSILPSFVTADLDGNERIVDGNGDSTTTIDMGAFEYVPSDCNANSIGDNTDILNGTSHDWNSNDVPDECETTIVYVDQDITIPLASQDGESWSTAHEDLAVAIETWVSRKFNNELIIEFWVAEGSYHADGFVFQSGRGSTFPMYPCVSIYGGFDGTESSRDSRDHDLNLTILTGEMQGDSDITNNAFSVVSSYWYSQNSILDGFVITKGNANNVISGPYGLGTFGGGLFNNCGNPHVENCTFLDNQGFSGGAVVNYRNGTGGNYVNCKFFENRAIGGSVNTLHKGKGGAVYNMSGCTPSFVGCLFVGNIAYENSDSTGGQGGAMCNQKFSTDYAPDVSLINCTVAHNSAEIAGGGLFTDAYASADAANCIFWGNVVGASSGETDQVNGATNTVSFSCIQGCSVTGYCPSGTSNIGDDPIFNDADGADDTLGTDDDDVHLTSSSPCVEAGDDFVVPSSLTTDLDGYTRISDGNGDATSTVDIGAYEYH